APAASTRVLTADVTGGGGKSYTATALSVNGQAQLKILNNELAAPTGKSWVRVIQASSKQNAVKFHCSCAAGAPGDIVTKASSGSVSSYAAIPPGTWPMSATGPSAEANLPVTLADSTVHTEVVIDGSSGLQIINLLDAAGAGLTARVDSGHRRRVAARPDRRHLAAPQQAAPSDHLGIPVLSSGPAA